MSQLNRERRKEAKERNLPKEDEPKKNQCKGRCHLNGEEMCDRVRGYGLSLMQVIRLSAEKVKETNENPKQKKEGQERKWLSSAVRLCCK